MTGPLVFLCLQAGVLMVYSKGILQKCPHFNDLIQLSRVPFINPPFWGTASSLPHAAIVRTVKCDFLTSAI